MRLRSICAALVLAMLLAVSFAGALCEAGCVPAGRQAHGCCPASMGANSVRAAISSPAECAHPTHEQAGLIGAPIFVMPALEATSAASAAGFAVVLAPPVAPATHSPPIFPLRI